MVGDNPAVQTRLLSRYLELTRVQLAAMAAAGTTNDTKIMATEAHKLKSASRSIGAMRLGDLCERIEAAGRSDDAAICNTLATDLPIFFFKVESRIQAHLTKPAN
jgi:HPt (histidine-containing phosphotransfer) domain-containing protein